MLRQTENYIISGEWTDPKVQVGSDFSIGNNIFSRGAQTLTRMIFSKYIYETENEN